MSDETQPIDPEPNLQALRSQEELLDAIKDRRSTVSAEPKVNRLLDDAEQLARAGRVDQAYERFVAAIISTAEVKDPPMGAAARVAAMRADLEAQFGSDLLSRFRILHRITKPLQDAATLAALGREAQALAALNKAERRLRYMCGEKTGLSAWWRRLQERYWDAGRWEIVGWVLVSAVAAVAAWQVIPAYRKEGEMAAAQADIHRAQERMTRIGEQEFAAVKRGAALNTDEEWGKAAAGLESAMERADQIHAWQGEHVLGFALVKSSPLLGVGFTLYLLFKFYVLFIRKRSAFEVASDHWLAVVKEAKQAEKVAGAAESAKAPDAVEKRKVATEKHAEAVRLSAEAHRVFVEALADARKQTEPK